MPRPATFDTLPDATIGAIFAAAGPEAEPSLALVCRRWHRVLYSEPALWRYVELSGKALAAAAEAGQSAQWFSTQRAMLQRIGGFVAELIVIDACVVEVAGRRKRECGALQRMAQECGSNWQLTRDVLSHLSPSSLTSLGLLWGPPALDEAAMAALGRLSRLTSLWLESGSSLPTSTADVLPRLQRLQQLALASPVLPASLLAALVQLLALVELDCSGDTLPPLDVLPRISQLTHLRWKEDSRQDGYLRPDVQRLLERLPALESWQIGSGRDIVWHGCMQIAGATLDKCEGSGRSPAVGTRQLTLHGIHHLPSLQRLAEAVLPAGTPPSSLQSLSIFHSRLRTAALLNCAHLAQLTRLLVSVTEFEGGGGPQAGIAALLQQAPRLQSLTLLGCFRGHPVPPAVAACTGLRRLSLQNNKLADLPDGPYLTGLEALHLPCNTLARLPPALSAATNLTKLCVLDNPQLALTDSCIDGVLMRMKQLRVVAMDSLRTPPVVLWRLCRAAPQLQITDQRTFI